MNAKTVYWECSRCWAAVSRFEYEDAPNFCDGCRGTTFNLMSVPPDKPAPPAASGEKHAPGCEWWVGECSCAPAPAPEGAVRMHRIRVADGPLTLWVVCQGTSSCSGPTFEHADFYPASALAAKDEEMKGWHSTALVLAKQAKDRDAALAEAKREIERLRQKGKHRERHPRPAEGGALTSTS